MAGADASFGVEIWTLNSTGSPAVVVTGTCMVRMMSKEDGWEEGGKGEMAEAKASEGEERRGPNDGALVYIRDIYLAPSP